MLYCSEKKPWKWTIAMVNWKTKALLKWQLKMLYEFHSPDQFRLVIVDNSKELKRHGFPRFKNLEVWKGSKDHPHGYSLTRVLEDTNTPFFLAQDPDFFWLRKGHLNWLADFLQNNYSAGAPYTDQYYSRIGDVDPKAPACWGCAYQTDKIKHLDFTADGWSPEALHKDTGWKIRDALQHDPFISFEWGKYTGPNYGPCNWAEKSHPESPYEASCLPKVCYYKGEPVAAHFERGDFSHQDGFQDDIREQYAEYFYDSAV